MITKEQMLAALKVLIEDESVKDMVYQVREHAREDMDSDELVKYKSSWDLPRVIAYSDACEVLKGYLAQERKV